MRIVASPVSFGKKFCDSCVATSPTPHKRIKDGITLCCWSGRQYTCWSIYLIRNAFIRTHQSETKSASLHHAVYDLRWDLFAMGAYTMERFTNVRFQNNMCERSRPTVIAIVFFWRILNHFDLPWRTVVRRFHFIVFVARFIAFSLANYFIHQRQSLFRIV